jgi:eukaryotic-like serine/threonine-protein kinase
MSVEYHLLFAVLAFEDELIDLQQLTSACRAWASDKSKPLADLLVERGWVTADDRAFIDKKAERKLTKHENDPRVTLNAATRGDVCEALLKEVDDSEVQQSLSSWPSSGPVLIETIGETLGEPEQPKSRYTWVSEVGKGGLGKVWLARDNELAREVALKEVKPGSASTEAVRRLIKEAQITGQLQHPNIVPVYEVNRGGRPFYTMKLVKGETLSQALRRQHEQLRAGHEDQLSLPRLLNVFVNVCEALAYAHSRGIIHRDLKPENIVLGDYGEAIVLDWGLAKQIGSADEETAPVVLTDDAQSHATRQGATPGTPAYMSPEQAAGRVDLLDHRTDIYGLGTILFEILTGQAPHRPPVADAGSIGTDAPRLSIANLLHRISEAPTPRARDVDPTISRELDAICATAMSRKRDERYHDAKSLAADVKRSLAHQPVSVYRTGAWERLRLWRRRNPVVASLSLFLAVSLLAGSVASTLFGIKANREADRANLNAERERKERERADEETRRGQRLLYAANMNLAQAAWEDNHIGRLRELLTETQLQPGKPDLRGFEWYYWNRQAHSYQMSFEGHTGPVSSVAFSADGKRLASAGGFGDQTVKVWDITSGLEAITLKGHTSDVTSVAFSSDGKRLASASDDQTVKLWDATSGKETLTLKGHTGRVDILAFGADGKRLTSASNDGTVKLWDTTSGLETLTLREQRCVAFSPDGKRLASASYDGTVKVWDATSGLEMLTLTLKGHTGGINCLALSADGKRLASASYDQTVKVWDTTSGLETLTLKGHTGEVYSVAFGTDEKWLASASGDETVKVWDTTNGQETLTLKGHTDWVRSVAFSWDGKRLVSVSDDQTVKLWNATSGQETLTLKRHTGPVRSVVFSPDGQRLASASDDRTVKLWNATSGQETLTLKGHTGPVRSVAFSWDGKRLASVSDDQTVKLWNATSGQETLTLKGHTGPVRSVAFSSDGKRLASASDDHAVKLWNTTSGQETLRLKGHTEPVTSVAFSADGKRLASASWDQTVKVWDTSSGQQTLTLKGHNARVYGVAFSPDGKRLASAGGDQTVKLWDATSGQQTLTLKGHTNWVESVAFSADGKRLASVSDDETVKVWDATSGQQVLTLKGHTNWVESAAFSADGKRLASASEDGTVKVWDARPWTPEIYAEREALSLIHSLRVQGQSPSEWLAAIAADQTLTEPVRQRALQFAREWK